MSCRVFSVTVPLVLLLGLGVTPGADAVSGSRTKYETALKSHPHLVRYYTFDRATPTNPVVASAAGEAEPLTWSGKGPFTVVDGYWNGAKAVRFDDGWFQAKPFDLPDRRGTFELRFRKHGQGVQLGNGRPNGMLFAQGDGYWSGLRVWTGYPDRQLHFEIGRPKPSHAFGLTAAEPVADGVWNHVVATWDGRQMRLYVNGILVTAAAYDGPYTAAGGPLKIGFANAGIGSLKLDVQELAVYRQALAPAEILAHALAEAEFPQAAQAPLAAGTEALAQQNWSAAGEAFAKMAQQPDLPPAFVAVARMALARTLRQRNRTAEAIAQYAAIYDDAHAPAPLQQIALRQCVPIERNPVHAVAPAAAYRRLLEFPDLSPADRVTVRLYLAERCLQQGEATAAREQYQEVLHAEGLAAAEVWNIRLQLAHTHLAAREFAAAREQYQRLAAMPGAPVPVRGIALLCAAQSHAREKSFAAAADAFAKIVAAADLPRHLRDEARERIAEMRRAAQGVPARDPAANRVKLPPAAAPAVSLYVAPDGSDKNPGTQTQPFASLRRARDAVRERKTGNSGLPPGGIAVVMRGGSYPVRETFELTAADSGTAESPIVYRAAPGETPVFTGGVKLDGFARVTDSAVLARLPEEARGKVFQVNVREQGVTDLGSLAPRGYGSGYPAQPWVDLYVNGKAISLARWPNAGSVKVGQVYRGDWQSKERSGDGEFGYAGDRPARWAAADDVWVWGAWCHLWEGRYLRVAAIDQRQHRLTVTKPSVYGFRQGQPYHYLNLLEEIDQPGEWYLDRKTGLLYLYPPTNARGAVVQMPVFARPFVMLRDASHVTLRGLVFETGRADGVVIQGGNDVLLAGCTLQQLGGNGVVVAGGARHGLLGCDIRSVGAGGVRVAGGDRKTLTPAGHFVENCHIHDFSRVDRVYAPAVHVDGVGCRIAHNLMHDSPHHALRIEGYEHAIEFNEIHSVVCEFDDQGGIDIFGNPAYRGLVIRYNFWHHIGSGHDVAGQAGIRLDDAISDVLLYGNVFYRCSGGHFGGVQIHGGKDNHVDNNLFVDCKYAVSFSAWGQQRWEQWLADPDVQRHVAQGGVDITKPPYSERYPDLAHLTKNADRNFLWRNLAVACGRFAARDRGVNELYDNCVYGSDPGFVDVAHRNFMLPADSPVYDRCGFRPIPFAEIGLYQDASRATWPVRHEVTPYYVPQQ
jgi:hypothetical protein